MSLFYQEQDQSIIAQDFNLLPVTELSMTKIDIDQVEAGKAGDSKAVTEEIRFGAIFRAARESSGFTVERAAMATRISQPFIEALERDDFDKLPGAVFGRGFIRNLYHKSCKDYE